LNKAFKFNIGKKTHLIFVKNSYKNKPSTEEIKYYENVDEMLANFNCDDNYFNYAIKVE
jgi:hypothetical protein